jgi:hypothetical protein
MIRTPRELLWPWSPSLCAKAGNATKAVIIAPSKAPFGPLEIGKQDISRFLKAR